MPVPVLREFWAAQIERVGAETTTGSTTRSRTARFTSWVKNKWSDTPHANYEGAAEYIRTTEKLDDLAATLRSTYGFRTQTQAKTLEANALKIGQFKDNALARQYRCWYRPAQAIGTVQIATELMYPETKETESSDEKTASFSDFTDDGCTAAAEEAFADFEKVLDQINFS